MKMRVYMGRIKTAASGGFTLLELLVAIGLSSIVVSGIYSTYYSQQKSYVRQTEVSAMQQNLRAAMYHMEREMRMAGYDPTRRAGAGFQTANSTSVRFTTDLTDDSGTGAPDGDADDADEDITYSLYDSDGDGNSDLCKKVGAGSNQPVAQNIDALNIVYLDQNGNVTSTLSDIRSVQVSLLAKSGRRDQTYINNTTYRNQNGTAIYNAPGDSFHRKLSTAQIKCRNMGL